MAINFKYLIIRLLSGKEARKIAAYSGQEI